MLVSPTRGLLVFSPFLVFIPVGLIQRLRTPSSRRLAIALSVAVVAQFLLYSQADWRAGVSWGPRWLTDLLPILVWMLAPAPLALRPLARRLLVATMVAAVGVQAIGAFWYTKTSDERIFAGDPASMRAAWNPSNIALRRRTAPSRPRPASFSATRAARSTGSGRRVLRNGGAVAELQPGAVLEGWALTCGRTPAQVLVLIDGMVIGATQALHAARGRRSSAAHHLARRAGASPPTPVGVAPGEHVLQLAVRVEPRSDIRIVREAARA